MIAAACVLAPLAAAAVLAVLPAGWGSRVNLAASALAFGLAACLPWAAPATGGWLLADGLGVLLAVLTAFVGLTTAWFNVGYIEVEAEEGRLEGARLRLYHALFQAMLGCVLLALLSDHPGITWGAMAGATVAAVLSAGLPGTREAMEAAWRGLMLAGVGLALALFGTIALYLAAPGLAAMSWSGLAGAAPGLPGTTLTLAFVMLLAGYGTAAALAPLHAWMPGLHAEGPTPLSAILAGSVLNAALAVLLRLRGLMEGSAVPPGPALLALGALSVLLAGFGLWRRRSIGRFLAVSTIGQGGVACLAFGLGTPAATFAGLLHMAVHTLSRAAALQCAGRASQLKGGQGFADQGGLIFSHPALGLPLAAGMIALAGLPPFGLLASEFLILAELARVAPALLLPVGAGLVAGAWAMAARMQGLCLGPPTPDHGPAPGRAALAGAWLHLALAAALGLLMPAPVAAWLRAAAEALP